ncbi:MAG: hypothetical protein AAFU65_01210 [Pseudomonadota bacterium]
MDHRHKPILTDLLTTSRQLAEAASAGDWDVVGELRGQHEKLVRTFFNQLNGGPLSAHVLSELTQVRVYTDLVLELAKKRRSGLVEAGQALQERKRATQAYAAAANP